MRMVNGTVGHGGMASLMGKIYQKHLYRLELKISHKNTSFPKTVFVINIQCHIFIENSHKIDRSESNIFENLFYGTLMAE